jgi:tRNA1(Val) A37 N6-methylase TrmN6
MSSAKDFTEDTLFNRRIKCLQHREGYRFSVDAVLLGNFIQPGPGDRILDLGCGCGIILLILAYRWPGVSITGLEIQPDLASLARKNVELNDWQKRIEIVAGDLKKIETHVQAGVFDVVVSNPPYRKSGSGRINLDDEKTAARHEKLADLANVIHAAVWAVKKKGRVTLIYPAARGASVISGLKNAGLEPKKILSIFSYPDSPASLLIIEAVKQGGEEVTILPPFYIYKEKGGAYSQEMAEYYSP